ncbi:lipocalin family protein [Chitinophaga nivalis]|uniref:Lipocalin family protein n=1 Tax=Chitinophaga nivalis TaxID=2991709 RepID=A0ABT3IKR1_9BACT|nr:lipocalin family protein [Chitinophaga nivalis]MCW3465748.1 lipocalin family protein [Chitinophaga nivalis]MCW3484561.1 lipocalin family protein [Chitinophaga nivalis]
MKKKYYRHRLLFGLMAVISACSQPAASIVHKWQPVKFTYTIYADNAQKEEKTDTHFTPVDVMDFKADGTIDDGGQRYEAYRLSPDNKNITLVETNGATREFQIKTLTNQQLILQKEDTTTSRQVLIKMVMEIHFKQADK